MASTPGNILATGGNVHAIRSSRQKFWQGLLFQLKLLGAGGLLACMITAAMYFFQHNEPLLGIALMLPGGIGAAAVIWLSAKNG